MIKPSELCTPYTGLICVLNVCMNFTETIAVELQLVNLLNVNLNLSGVSLIWDMEQKQDEHKVTKTQWFICVCSNIIRALGTGCILRSD